MNNVKYFGLLSVIFLATSLIADNYFDSVRAYIVAVIFVIIAFVYKIKPIIPDITKQSPTKRGKTTHRVVRR